MEYKFSSSNYNSRIAVELIFGGSIALFFLGSFLYSIIKSNDLSVIIFTGVIALWSLYLTITRLNWYNVFISHVYLDYDKMIIEYAFRNKLMEPLILDFTKSSISISRKGWGGSIVFFTISEGDYQITQIQTSPWTNKVIGQFFKDFKSLRGQKLTFDENDILEKLLK